MSQWGFQRGSGFGGVGLGGGGLCSYCYQGAGDFGVGEVEVSD